MKRLWCGSRSKRNIAQHQHLNESPKQVITIKIDRLLGITIYLLNHQKTSAQVLAEHFEVSTRTIIRDMECLCLAGIPVVSTYGADGGYAIDSTFKMERQVAGATDYSYIVTALKGFATAYNSRELEETLQKIQAVSRGSPNHVVLDLGVAGEKKHINQKLSIFEQAIKEQRTVSFPYTNADHIQKEIEAEPIATIYKWYNWYLLSYLPKHDDYRIFKLERMGDIRVHHQRNSKEHQVEYALEQWEKQGDRRTYIHLKLHCKHEIRVTCMEYLNGSITHEFENGDAIMTMTVPENEQFWYGALLSFGNKVKVLEPRELRRKIRATCQELLQEYPDV